MKISRWAKYFYDKWGFYPMAGGSGLFSSKPQQTTSTQPYDPYAGLRSSVSSYLSGQVGQPGPSYSGQLVAPLSNAQNQSMDVLNQYASNPNTYTGGQGYQSAINQLSNTVNGNYDPSTSPYYQAMKAEANRNNTLAIQQTQNEAGMGNNFYSGARLQNEGNVNAQTSNYQNAILGQLTQQERQNQLNAAPELASLSAAQTQAPLGVVSALQNYGALPQQQQQAYDTALLNQWTQQNYQYPLSIDQLAMGGQMMPLTTANYPGSNNIGDAGTIAASLLGGKNNPFQSAINGALPAVGGAISSALPAIGAAASGAGASIASFLPALLGML